MTVRPPIVLAPLYDCAGAVQVGGLDPDALVRVFQDGEPRGAGRASARSSVGVRVDPPLRAGRTVTATQAVGEVVSGPSERMEVRPLGQLHRPRVLSPVALGDTVVWVSGVTPGAHVSVHSAGEVIGEEDAAESLVSVPVAAVSAAVHATVRLCDVTRSSVPVQPVTDPSELGPEPRVSDVGVSFGSFAVPRHPTPSGFDGDFEVELRGRVYLAVDAEGEPSGGVRDRPLVVIAHGYWPLPDEDETSLEGYSWLAEHLAGWGALVCSVDLSEVNRRTAPEAQQWARGEVILAMVDRLSSIPPVARLVDPGHVGLVGHSMGGEGIVVAQVLNQQRHRPYGIRGVVSLAPTNYRPELASTHTAYLQLHGSLDYLLSPPDTVTGRTPRFGGFRLYDRAWRHRSLAWIRGARHEGWNPRWLASPSSVEFPADPEMPASRQQSVGRGLVTAFFLDTLFDLPVYRGYLAGPARPQGFGSAVVYMEHQSPSVEVIDDFGDANEQIGLGAEEPPDKTVNRRSQPVAAAGSGLDRWEDVDHITLARSVHDTRGTDLAWLSDDVVYESGLGSLGATPTDVLSLRVTQHYQETTTEDPDETWNPIGRDVDLLVEVDDGAESATVRLGAAGVVPYPLAGVETYSVFRTVRLPIDAFSAVNPSLDLRSLQRLRLRPALRETGRILIDDIELVTALVTAPGLVTLLRAHEHGTGFGPADDHIDAEVIVQIDSRPGESFGLQLRAEPRLPAARNMLATLRAAFAGNTPVRIAYVRVGPSVRQIIGVQRTATPGPGVQAATGALTMLRVHELGTGFGPPDDHIDAEVIVQIDSRPGESFGLQLRAEPRLAAARNMLATLRDTLATGGTVRLEFVQTGATVRRILRVTTS